MLIDELESPGTFVDFSWRSIDRDEEGPMPLAVAFALFTNAPRHAVTGAIIWPPARQAPLQEKPDDNKD